MNEDQIRELIRRGEVYGQYVYVPNTDKWEEIPPSQRAGPFMVGFDLPPRR